MYTVTSMNWKVHHVDGYVPRAANVKQLTASTLDVTNRQEPIMFQSMSHYILRLSAGNIALQIDKHRCCMRWCGFRTGASCESKKKWLQDLCRLIRLLSWNDRIYLLIENCVLRQSPTLLKALWCPMISLHASTCIYTHRLCTRMQPLFSIIAWPCLCFCVIYLVSLHLQTKFMFIKKWTLWCVSVFLSAYGMHHCCCLLHINLQETGCIAAGPHRN